MENSKMKSIKLFEEVKEKIKNEIKDYEANVSIGSERELSENFLVSRPTVRKALEALEDEGTIYKVPYKGYLKSEEKEKYIDHELNSFIGFFEDAENQNKEVFSKVIQQTIVLSKKDVAEKLSVPENTELFVLERLRYVEEKPICLVKTFLVLNKIPDLVKSDFSKDSLYKKLEEKNIKLAKAKRSIEIKRPKSKEIHLLNLSNNEPIFLFESLVFLEDGTPFEYTTSKYPAFDVKFATEVSF